MFKTLCASRRLFATTHLSTWVNLVSLLVIIVLLGIPVSAVAQTRPVDTQQSDTASVGQTPSSDSVQGQAGPIADPGQGQGFVHIVPFRDAAAPKISFAPSGAHLTYWGGPVIANIHVIAVFWGPNVNPVITGGIGQFFTDITSSRYYDLLSEYNTTGIIGAAVPAISSNQVIGHGQFDGAVTITPSLCPGPTACTITNAQVAAEIVNQIVAGHLPQPLTDNQGNINSFYMIYFPPGVTITLSPTVKSCAQFCAYHFNTASTALLPKMVPYGVEPDFGPAPNSACALGCGGNSTLFDDATEVTSHEMSEAVTDALVGSAPNTPTPGPPMAWYDFPPDLGEIGDLCVGQSTSVPAGNTTYVVQAEFSNLQNDCVFAPPVFNLITPAVGAGPSLPFNGTLKIQSSISPFTLTGYSGTVHFTSSDPQAILPADYTFVPGDAGTHIFSFTLKTLGDQTITVTDTHSNGFTGTATVNVNLTPDLTIAKSHSGNFSVGQTGATYTITASNVGRGPTVGTVTVTDTLPTGLTATAIGGTGWSCTLGTLICTRADALAALSSYPAITVTVNVAANAPALVTNSATVSGGGEVNVANNTANDPTTVLTPDLVASKSHFGPIFGNFFQGETGATYTITVQNIGTLATSGTVTVVDTLPPTGLNPTAISGTGWTCTLATLTCTRSDALAGGFTSYPPITLTVDVPLGAPANVTNAATVSGGGEVNTGNDLAQDFTTILPPPAPDLAPFMNHLPNFVQGQSGSFYRIDISNVGTATTSGTVTVSDTLPTGLTATDVSGIGWTCTVGATSTCTQSTPLLFNNSYAPIFITVAIAADAPTSVVNTVTVSGGGDTNNANNSFSDPTSIATPLVDLTPSVAGSAFEAAGDTGINYTILIQNAGNISTNGSTITAVTNLSTGITATALSGGGWNCTLSNLTCTRSDALTPFGFFPINVTVNFAKNAPATGSVGETVSGGGDGNAANNTSSEFVNIQPMLGINPLTTLQTINAGTPAIYSLIVNPLTAAGPATMSCSGLPAASTCTFNPATAPAGVGGVGITLTINTTARTAAVVDLRTGPWNYRPLFPLLLLITVILAAIGMRHRLVQGGRLKPALALAGLVLLAALSGCGGGGGSTTTVQNAQGTPAGTYTVTVNATSPNASASTPVTLIVK